MEVITIEKQAYEKLLNKIKSVASRIDTLCERHNDKSLKIWIDSQEVCQILSISKRQLQTYRDNGTVAYAKIEHRIFYRPQDIQRLIDKHTINSLCQK